MFIPERFEATRGAETEAGVSRTDALILGAMALLVACVAFVPDTGLSIAANRAGLPWGGLIIALLMFLSLGLASLMARRAFKQKLLVEPMNLDLAILPELGFLQSARQLPVQVFTGTRKPGQRRLRQRRKTNHVKTKWRPNES